MVSSDCVARTVARPAQRDAVVFGCVLVLAFHSFSQVNSEVIACTARLALVAVEVEPEPAYCSPPLCVPSMLLLLLMPSAVIRLGMSGALASGGGVLAAVSYVADRAEHQRPSTSQQRPMRMRR